MSREELIARKGTIRAELPARSGARTHPTEAETASGLRRRYLQRRVAQLEAPSDALMSEEYRVRQLIDQPR